MMLRSLLRIASRVGRPGTLLSLADSGGSLLYLEAAMHPVSVTVALHREDVAALAEACAGWLAEHDPAPFGRPDPAPLIAGAVARGLADARSTVQLRTVHTAARGSDQRESV